MPTNPAPNVSHPGPSRKNDTFPTMTIPAQTETLAKVEVLADLDRRATDPPRGPND